jgi:hypothetical protein
MYRRRGSAIGPSGSVAITGVYDGGSYNIIFFFETTISVKPASWENLVADGYHYQYIQEGGEPGDNHVSLHFFGDPVMGETWSISYAIDDLIFAGGLKLTVPQAGIIES